MLWGTTATAGSLAPAGVPAAAVGAAGLALGGLLLFLTAPAARSLPGACTGGERRLIAVGTLAVAGYPLTFYPAVARTGVAVAQPKTITYEDDEQDIANAKREEARYEAERSDDEDEESGSRSSRGGRSSYRSSYRYSYRGPTAAERAAEAARAARIAAARRPAVRAAIRAHAVKLTHSIGTATLSVTHSAHLKHLDPVTKLKIALSLAAIRMGPTENFYFSGGASDEESDGCGSAGWIKYGDRDAANGNRATGVDACPTDPLQKGSKAKTSDVPGYKWAQDYSDELGVENPKYSVNACHLLGAQLGGKGRLENEATCGRSTNANKMDETDPGRAGNMRIRGRYKGGSSGRSRRPLPRRTDVCG
ncbi:hypothetical protein ACWCY6_21495 [Streptomyces sp. 900105755]